MKIRPAAKKSRKRQDTPPKSRKVHFRDGNTSPKKERGKRMSIISPMRIRSSGINRPIMTREGECYKYSNLTPDFLNQDLRTYLPEPKSPESPNTNLIEICEGYWIEEYSDIENIHDIRMSVNNQKFSNRWYNEHFYGKEHKNFIGNDKEYGPFILSLKFKRMEDHIVITSLLKTYKEDVNCVFNSISEKNVAKYIVMELDDCIVPRKLKYIKDPSFEEELSRFESEHHVPNFKFGVLYCKEGQTTEEEMFSNEHGSLAFITFLELLGDYVTLSGFEKFRGGLDTKYNSTGEKSLYTEWGNYEIMYHVSTLLPYSSSNPQQLNRKRHLGNDIVTIIFKEGNIPYKPNTIASTFNHIYIVVQHFEENGKTWYKINCCSKNAVNEFGPYLPKEGVLFPHGELARNFLICKAINAERNALHSQEFEHTINESRIYKLKCLRDKYVKPPNKTVI
eukprot:TRINITY_DN2688_c0_g1_i1.p1 TRINITY_DN2688_c0_g1~~TRINITY_DN2688_c0_g1_i1.p1  ORF type:complete len:450 (-),score=81.17 TRINITY_DN2688_c0_g1_i1:1148-2497(-)